jgi:hypothetical protein
MSMDTLDKIITAFLFLLIALPFIMLIQFKIKKERVIITSFYLIFRLLFLHLLYQCFY